MTEIISYKDSISIQIAQHYLENYRETKSIHLVEVGTILYNKGPTVDNTKEIITFMFDQRVPVLILQRYKKCLKARTRHYELSDLL